MGNISQRASSRLIALGIFRSRNEIARYQLLQIRKKLIINAVLIKINKNVKRIKAKSKLLFNSLKPSSIK